LTTNVYDRQTGIAGTDSRWSVEREYAIFYVDDTGFEKIVARDDAIFVFAGNSAVIQQWKDYLASERYSHIVTEPPLEGIALLIIDALTKKIEYGYGQDIILPDIHGEAVASFAGTGGRRAAACWIKNGCTKRAIDTAKQVDVFSGGETKFFELTSRTGNLMQDVGLDGLTAAFSQRGMVMFMAQVDKPVTLQEAIAMDPRVAEFAREVAAGQVPLSAPCDSMLNTPTAADKAALKQALGKVLKR